MINESNVCIYLILRGKSVDPDEVTSLLGIVPDTKHKVGEIHGQNQEMVWETGLWLLDSSGHIQSEDIEKHIAWVLDQLEPMKLTLATIRTKPDIHIVLKMIFSLFSANWETKITNRTIDRLAELKIPLDISFWYLGYKDEEEEFCSN